MIKRVRHLLPLHAKLTPYHCLTILLLYYGDTLWGDKSNDTFIGNNNFHNEASSTEALDRFEVIVLLTLIKLAEAIIYTILVCVPIGARKLQKIHFSSTKH